jgi:hypothetical protein
MANNVCMPSSRNQYENKNTQIENLRSKKDSISGNIRALASINTADTVATYLASTEISLTTKWEAAKKLCLTTRKVLCLDTEFSGNAS